MAERFAKLQGVGGRLGARAAHGLLALDLVVVAWVVFERGSAIQAAA
jgi:hypothetical protein